MTGGKLFPHVHRLVGLFLVSVILMGLKIGIVESFEFELDMTKVFCGKKHVKE